jgi:hypothetical protein
MVPSLNGSLKVTTRFCQDSIRGYLYRKLTRTFHGTLLLP